MKEYKLTEEIKRRVRLRAKNCCEYCLSQEKFATQQFSIEHILPISKGGKTILDNLALACQGCNNHKYNKIEGYDQLSNQIVSLYHPRKQNWQDHFRWNNNYDLIIGLTPNAIIDSEIGEIINGVKPERENDHEITLFKSVGVAIQDTLIANLILENAIKKKLGIRIDL